MIDDWMLAGLAKRDVGGSLRHAARSSAEFIAAPIDKKRASKRRAPHFIQTQLGRGWRGV